MTGEPTFEDEIAALVDDANRDRKRLQLRIANGQQALEDVDRKIEAYHVTLSDYRRRYGIDPGDAVPPRDLEAAEALGRLDTKGMLLYWADEHHGDLIVSDMVKAVTKAGLFQNKEQATSTLYASLGRMADLFEKVDRGHYRRAVLAAAPWVVMPAPAETSGAARSVEVMGTPLDGQPMKSSVTNQSPLPGAIPIPTSVKPE